jgi:L-threonylcarbamoyladenylate synthase
MSLAKRETRLIQDPDTAGQLLAEGQLVAFPTETVYGLGGAIDSPETIQRIFVAKGRPADNPLIVHLVERSVLEEVVSEIPSMAQELMDQFWPGPLTIVFKKQTWISDLVTAGLDSVAVRSPANLVAQQILRKCRRPIAAPSANSSGRPSATTWQAVYEDLNGKIDAIFQGEPCLVGIESTVVDCTGRQPELLRSGAVTIEQLRTVRPDTILLKRAEATANSPGLRHRHYQPTAKVLIVDVVSQIEPEANAGLLCLNPHVLGNQFGYYRCLTDVPGYAAEMYEFFREADRLGLRKVFCERVPAGGLGDAVRDRLSRAADLK